MCQIDYADPADGFWRKALHEVNGRKDHRCEDCGRIIAKGERHTAGTWLDREDSVMMDVRMCAQCVAAGKWLVEVCGGHFWPGVLEELEEHWDEETDLRSWALHRLVRVAKAGWLWHGELRTVDQVGELVEIALGPPRAKDAVAA